jgi:hypothetical protein
MSHFATITKTQERYAPKAGLVWSYKCHTCGSEDQSSSYDIAYQIAVEDHDGEQVIVGDGKGIRAATTNPSFPLTIEVASTLLGRTLAYLPGNYEAGLVRDWNDPTGDGYLVKVVGIDNAGWTLDGYVVPRLASGNIFLTEVK